MDRPRNRLRARRDHRDRRSAGRWGIYHDHYTKVSGRWRIANLRLERLLVEPVENDAPTEPRSLANKLETILSDDRNVVITGTFSHVIKRSGKTFTTPIALRLEVQEGKISRLQLYEDTLLIAQAFDAADGAPSVGQCESSQARSAPSHAYRCGGVPRNCA